MAQFKMAASFKAGKEISTVFRILSPSVMKIRTRKKTVCKGVTGHPNKSEMKNSEAALVVGLGNPDLPGTRHSVGMSVVDHLASRLSASWKYNKQCVGYVALAHLGKRQVILLKPKLAMNINGRSIGKAYEMLLSSAAILPYFSTVTMFQVPLVNVFLVHDDLDKPLGKYSIKHGGSAGGHNGVKSAIGSLRSDIMKRLRFGIGRPADKSQVVQYVLGDFRSSEVPIVQDTVGKCVDVLLELLQTETETKEKHERLEPTQMVGEESYAAVKFMKSYNTV